MTRPLFEQPWPAGDYRLFQLGFVVVDLIDAAGRWAEVFGIGPFHVLPPRAVECTHRGGPTSTIELQVGVAQAGPVQIELIEQHGHAPSIFVDHVRTGRGSLHQLCTITSDFEGKKAHYHRLGYEVATELLSPGPRVAFIDTLADFGFYTEVVESRASFLDQLTAIARTCAHWDGTDPVRLLTRDGYRTP
ncbi:MAG: VOC family protein [Acidimicrobiales bacterium]